MNQNIIEIKKNASYIYDLKVSDSLRNLGCGQRPLYIYIYRKWGKNGHLPKDGE